MNLHRKWRRNTSTRAKPAPLTYAETYACICTNWVSTLHLQDLPHPALHMIVKLCTRPRWARRDKVSNWTSSFTGSNSFFLTSLMQQLSCLTHSWAELICGRVHRVEKRIRYESFITQMQCWEWLLYNFMDEFLTGPTPTNTRMACDEMRLEIILFYYFIRWTSSQYYGTVQV